MQTIFYNSPLATSSAAGKTKQGRNRFKIYSFEVGVDKTTGLQQRI